jgi:hypothetical protein
MAQVTLNEMNEMLNQAVTRLKTLGYKVGKVVDLEVSYRYSRAWAKCKWNRPRYDKTFTIIVSDRLFKANKESVRDIIHHEVIHTIPGCFNHGTMFKNAAGHCNKKFGTHITVTAPEEVVYFGHDSIQAREYEKRIAQFKQQRKAALKARRLALQAACK